MNRVPTRNVLTSRGVLLAAALVCLGERASAGLLDKLRELDMNDYAAGVVFSGSDNVYAGTDGARFLYPILSHFYPGDFDDRVLFSRDSGIGLRWAPESGFELGALIKFQGLGFVAGDSSALDGLPDRNWTLEVGPTIGWRSRSIHVDWTGYVDLLRNHTGGNQLLRFTWPLRSERGYLVPEIAFRRYSEEFVDYYYGVPAAFATNDRPAYRGVATSSRSLALAWGVRATRKWLLSGRIGVERLDHGIAASPIVADDERAFMTLQLSYDEALFTSMDAPLRAVSTQRPSSMVRLTRASLDVDASLAAVLAEGDQSVVSTSTAQADLLYLDAQLRIARRQLLTAGLFDSREALAAGGDADVRSGHLGYGIVALDDAQKSLSLYVGVHTGEIELALDGAGEGDAAEFAARSRGPRPMLGATGAARFRSKWFLNAEVQWFMLDSDRYTGRRVFAALNLAHRTFRRASFGIGYVFSRVYLDASEDALQTDVQAAYQGPSVSITGHF